MTLYWIDTAWACGGIVVEAGMIISGAPIFRRLVGQRFEDVKKFYRTEEVINFKEFMRDGRSERV